MNSRSAWEAVLRLVQSPSRRAIGARLVKEAAAGLDAREAVLWVRSRGVWHCRAQTGRANSAKVDVRPSVPSCVLHGEAACVRLPSGPSALAVLAGEGPGWLLLAPLTAGRGRARRARAGERTRRGRRAFIAVRIAGGRRPLEALHVLRAMAAQTARALREEESARRLKRLAATDDLTGAINYRALLAALRSHVRRAKARASGFSILMADLDHLKDYNEVHGHLGGSELLRRVGVILRDSVRPGDIVAKYGGDEFVLILPDTDLGVAAEIGERVRRAISSRAFPGATRGSITLSVGLASYPADGDSVGTLLRAADRALFAAKRLGRNRVHLASRAA